MAVDGYLNFDTKINTEGMDKGTKSVNNSLGSVKSTLGKVAIAATAAFSVTKLVQFGKQAVGTASDVAEVQNVVDTAFGSSKQKMEDFADVAIETYGISKLTAKGTGSTYMAMASGMGLANDNASDMAVSLTGLSADMASFYNVSQDVASTALKSVFTGETETLKQFGIVMTDANLQAFALSQGISKSTSEMSQAEKVQLRYAYVMQTTALAQGDFANTSDGWANQTRILSEKWKEFSATIGTVLMGVLLPAVKAINNMLSGLISVASQAADALSELFGIESESGGDIAQSTSELADSASTASTDYSDMAESAEDTEKANENQLASFDKINKLSDTPTSVAPTAMTTPTIDTKPMQTDVKSSLGKTKTQFEKFSKWLKGSFGGIFKGIWGGLTTEGSKLVKTFGKIFSDLSSLIAPFKSYLSTTFTTYMQTVFSTCGDILLGLFDTFNMVFSDIWNVALFPIISNFITVVLPMLTEFATQAWLTLGTLFNNIKVIFDTLWTGCISPILGFIAQAWCDLMLVLSDFWNTWGVPIFEGIRTAIENTRDILLAAWENVLKPVFDNIMAIIDKLWKEHLKPLIAEFLNFVGELANGALEIYNKFISPIVKWLIETLGPVVAKVASKIANTVGTVIGDIVDAVKGIIKVLTGIIHFVTGVFTGNWKKAWTGIKTIFSGIWDTFVGIVKAPINLIIGLINGMTGAIETAINWIVDKINELSFDVPDWVPVIGGETFGFDLSHVDIPDIPKLATGTVVPANYGEFVAVLGDNKRETEVVSPLSTIKQALAEVMGNNNSEQTIILHVDLDGKTIYKSVVDTNKRETRRTGVNALAI